MDNYIITVARQFGSLGRPIAKELSELLDINYYDRDIVEETAKKMGMTVSEVSNEEEVAKTPFFKMGFPLGMGTSAKQYDIDEMCADSWNWQTKNPVLLWDDVRIMFSEIIKMQFMYLSMHHMRQDCETVWICCIWIWKVRKKKFRKWIKQEMLIT